MRLSWQPGFTQSRKPLKKPNPRRAKRLTSSDGSRPRQFEFVVEHPHRNRSSECSSPPSVTEENYDSPVSSNASHQTIAHPDEIISGLNPQLAKRTSSAPSDEYQLYSDMEFAETPLQTSSEGSVLGIGEPGDGDMSHGPPYLPRDLHPNRGQPPTPSSPHDSTHQTHGPPDGSIGYGDTSNEESRDLAVSQDLDPSALSRLAETPSRFVASIPPNILYSNLSHKFQLILERYDAEFCKIPITSELCVNPFRCQVDLDSAPIFLVHAVMALAGHHVGSATAQSHRFAALQWLRQGLDGNDLANIGHFMLNTIIILFSFDEAQSAFGNWNTHLAGAYSLLEASGGINVWIQSTRSTVQVAMLLWWDAILSLLSREDCVFPEDYFEALVSCYDGQDWDFFGLCGCPFSLVRIVMQLARLGAEKRKSSSMRYVKFDDSLVTEVEHALESWQYSTAVTTAASASAYLGEDFIQRDRDAMHCCEAWRNGLSLYLYRVFRWQTGDNVPMNMLYNARAVMDHVTACRDESMVSRQALLPLFFAGCEMRDQSSRAKILKLCTFWNDETRYHLFSSAIPLLKEVWAKQHTDGFERVWWGQIVDQQHKSDSDHPLQVRLCFG